MISWALMANYSTLEHSKTLAKTQLLNFSTLASTLDVLRLKMFDLCRAQAEWSIKAEVGSKLAHSPL
jgi:hypothetical protein